jgi:hypothetical protein
MVVVVVVLLLLRTAAAAAAVVVVVVVSVAVNWAVGVDPRRRLLSLQTTAGSRQRRRYRRATTPS